MPKIELGIDKIEVLSGSHRDTMKAIGEDIKLLRDYMETFIESQDNLRKVVSANLNASNEDFKHVKETIEKVVEDMYTTHVEGITPINTKLRLLAAEIGMLEADKNEISKELSATRKIVDRLNNTFWERVKRFFGVK